MDLQLIAFAGGIYSVPVKRTGKQTYRRKLLGYRFKRRYDPMGSIAPIKKKYNRPLYSCPGENIL